MLRYLFATGSNAALFASCCVTAELKDKQCYVICQGKALMGKFVAWRNPCQAQWGIDVFEAVRPPPGACLPFDGCVVSSEDCSITLMAGGDYDGDHVLVSFDETPLKFSRIL